MGQITESIVKFFQDNDWSFQQIQLESETILVLKYAGDNGDFTCYAEADEEIEMFIFYSVCPVKPPKNKWQAVVEVLTRINYSLRNGSFEFNWEDGEIRCKTSIWVENTCLSSDLIKNVINFNLMVMDEYLPSIMAVIYGNVSPEEALATVES